MNKNLEKERKLQEVSLKLENEVELSFLTLNHETETLEFGLKFEMFCLNRKNEINGNKLWPAVPNSVQVWVAEPTIACYALLAYFLVYFSSQLPRQVGQPNHEFQMTSLLNS